MKVFMFRFQEAAKKQGGLSPCLVYPNLNGFETEKSEKSELFLDKLAFLLLF